VNGEGHYTGEINKFTRLPHGHGILKYTSIQKKNCISYTGGWENGLRHGHGSLKYTTGVYVGNFDRDVREGFGFFRWMDGAEYEGDFSHDSPNGKGKFRRQDGSVYNGDFKNGHMHGLGTLQYENGDFGVFNWSNGKIYTNSEQKRSKNNRKKWAMHQPQEEIILV